jgi:4'-phosphopantetheinyl transferase
METDRSSAQGRETADPQEPFRLEPGDVHVWLARIDDNVAPGDPLFADTLSDTELNRARQLLFDADRRRFLISHLLFRALLSRYLGRDARAIRLTHSPWGKPLLVDASGVDFNLAHSGGLAAYAFALHRQVGVDVERIRPTLDVKALAGRYFTPFEAQVLGETPEKERSARFFTYWVRKEAVLKGTGYGLRLSLSAVDVAGDQRDGGAVIAHVPVATPSDWQIMDLAAGEQHCAAVAVDRPPRCLSCRQISSESMLPIVDGQRLVSSSQAGALR